MYTQATTFPLKPTAFLEYALSSASVRASTKSRRRFGRFAFESFIRTVVLLEGESKISDGESSYHYATI